MQESSRLAKLLEKTEQVEDHTFTLLSDLILVNQIPAPTFQEAQRARFIKQRFEEFGLTGVMVDSTGNVCAEIQTGRRRGGAVLVSANLDTDLGPEENVFVSIEEDKAIGAGIGRNGLGLAGLLALGEILSTSEIAVKRDVILAATVAQHGEGGSRGMQEVAARYASRTGFALCLQGLGLRRIGHRSDARLGFEVRCTARRDDRWNGSAEGRAAGCLSEVLFEIFSLAMPKRSETRVGIVEIGGSDRGGLKADSVVRGEIVSSDDGAVGRVYERLRKRVEKAGKAMAEDVSLHPTGRFRPGGLPRSHPLVRQAAEIHRLLGIETLLGTHGGDGSVLSKAGVPTLTVGLSVGGFTEDGKEYIAIPSIRLGLKQVVLLLMTAGGPGPRKGKRRASSEGGSRR